jgi:hypothetical protein
MTAVSNLTTSCTTFIGVFHFMRKCFPHPAAGGTLTSMRHDDTARRCRAAANHVLTNETIMADDATNIFTRSYDSFGRQRRRGSPRRAVGPVFVRGQSLVLDHGGSVALQSRAF